MTNDLSFLDLYPKDKIFRDLLAAADIRWVPKSGYSRHGIAVKKLWGDRLLILEKGSKELHRVHASKITDYQL